MTEKIPFFDTTLSRRVEQLEDALMFLRDIPRRVEALELKAREDEQFTQALNNAPVTVIDGKAARDTAAFKRARDLLPSFEDMWPSEPIDQYVDGYQPPKVATEPTRSEQRQYLADWEANLNAKREALDKEIIEFQNCYKQFIAT